MRVIIYCKSRYHIWKFTELWIRAKMLKLDASNLKAVPKFNILCLSTNSMDSKLPHTNVDYAGDAWPSSPECCLKLHYQAKEDASNVHHYYELRLCNIHFHVHPEIVGQFLNFFDKINSVSPSLGSDGWESFIVKQNSKDSEIAGVQLSRFGFSKFVGTDDSLFAGIPLDQFPFLGMEERECPRTLNSNFSNRPGIVNNSKLRSLHNSNTVTLDLSLNGFRVHFHDSSGIVGTITFPASVSSLSFASSDIWDLLFSSQGIMLMSFCSSTNIHELLLGPSSPSNTSILNIRARKKTSDALFPSAEVNISIQNVGCILSSKFLAMVVGYFSLPDWGSGRNDHHNNGTNEFQKPQTANTDISYKFEIVDTSLILPVEHSRNDCLKLELPHLFCNFIPFSSSAEAAKDIPSHSLISDCSFSDKVDIVDLFGRSMSLSLLLITDRTDFLMTLDDYMSIGTLPLIEKLDADIWIRVPSNTMISSEQTTLPTSIMVKTESCHLIVEGINALHQLLFELILHL